MTLAVVLNEIKNAQLTLCVHNDNLAQKRHDKRTSQRQENKGPVRRRPEEKRTGVLQVRRQGPQTNPKLSFVTNDTVFKLNLFTRHCVSRPAADLFLFDISEYGVFGYCLGKEAWVFAIFDVTLSRRFPSTVNGRLSAVGSCFVH